MCIHYSTSECVTARHNASECVRVLNEFRDKFPKIVVGIHISVINAWYNVRNGQSFARETGAFRVGVLTGLITPSAFRGTFLGVDCANVLVSYKCCLRQARNCAEISSLRRGQRGKGGFPLAAGESSPLPFGISSPCKGRLKDSFARRTTYVARFGSVGAAAADYECHVGYAYGGRGFVFWFVRFVFWLCGFVFLVVRGCSAVTVWRGLALAASLSYAFSARYAFSALTPASCAAMSSSRSGITPSGRRSRYSAKVI